MPTTEIQNNKPSFVKSKTFIISTTLALVFFALFLVFVTLMKSRYDFCWKVITEYMKQNNTYDSLYEEGLMWKIFLMPQASLAKPIEAGEAELILTQPVIKTLTWYMPDWHNNLAYTIMTIITIFGTVICAFIPLSWCIAKLSEMKEKKPKKEKKAKVKKEKVKGN